MDVPQAYVMFEVSQFDSYSYLFDKPTFISLDPAARPGNIPLAGMRIGVNGSEAEVGQAYRTLDTADHRLAVRTARASRCRHRHGDRPGEGPGARTSSS